MNEAMTRRRLIDPALEDKGWDGPDNSAAWWFPEFPVCPGRIDSHGNHLKNEGFADYVLLHGKKPLAVIEAKADGHDYDEGETQAKHYAEMLGVRFAYATNGHKVKEWDLQTLATRDFPMGDFPTLSELLTMYGPDPRSELEKVCDTIPFSKAGNKVPRLYQERAVEGVIREIGRGKKRALLTLATGTGKTYIAYQLCYKLVEAKWRNGKPLGEREPSILFITDRNILADQAKDDFYFGDDACFRYTAGDKKVPMDRKVYFTLFQTLLGEDGTEEKYKKFKPDFFDMVIIDECHRGGANDESQWKEILNYFKDAVHVGLTATPNCDVNHDTYKYFGEPAFKYSLKWGIRDGYLTQYRVSQLKSTLRDYKVEDGDIIRYESVVDEGQEIDPDKTYHNDQLERNRIEIEERDRHFVDELFKRMPHDQKAIVFCVTQRHARRIAALINDEARKLGIGDLHYCETVTASTGTIGEGYLRQFQNNENTIPTILTTSQKLSTGVNAKNIRSIVLFRNVNSMVEFKQIIGRGTRTYPGKGYFTIYDFTGATDIFKRDDWDGDDGMIACPKCGECPCVCEKGGGGGGEHEPCPKCGFWPCICPKPPKPVIKIELGPDRVVEGHWEDYVFVDDKPVKVEDFVKEFVAAIKRLVSDEKDLRHKWSEPEERQELLEQLASYGYDKDSIVDIQAMFEHSDCDVLDVMLDLVYGTSPVTRAWRAAHLDSELAKMSEPRRKFAEVVLRDYVNNGVWSLGRDSLLSYIRMRYGTLEDAMRIFECRRTAEVGQFYDNIQRRLYAV